MLKVVLNENYGGYLLSPVAEALYAAKTGFKVYRYMMHYAYEGTYLKRIYDLKWYTDEMCYWLRKDLGEEVSYDGIDEDLFFYSGLIERDDEILVQVVEELGENAGEDCKLKIVEIPNDVEWYVDCCEHGTEIIREKHRIWS